MPIFGLVWMVSWVGCLFSSSGTRLLEAPSYLTHVFSRQALPSTTHHPLSNVSLGFQSTLSLANHPDRLSSVAAWQMPLNFNSRAIPLHQSAVAKAGWLEAIGAFLMPLNPRNHFQSPPVKASDRPLAWNDGSNSKPLNYFLEAVQGVFGGGRRVLGMKVVLPSVMVVPTPPPTFSVLTQQRFSTCGTAPTVRTKSANSQSFQVWVKGCLVAEIPDQNKAQALAATVEGLLQSDQLLANQLQPTTIEGKPAGKLGDRILFTIDKAMAAQLNDSPELAAVAWINNLRLALGEIPLPLAEAQVKMHRLYDTTMMIGGMASWYGPYFHGRQTATGEIFDQEELTAAHPSLPFDTYLKVTNLKNSQSVVVRVNDRGPYVGNRILDLSHRAARCIGSDQAGVVPISATIMLVDPTLDQRPPQTLAQL